MDAFLENFDFIAPFNEADSSIEHTKTKKQKQTEQKGRHKINEQINELKHLLPECRYVSTTKASVLECAVNSLKKLQNAKDQLEAANQKLHRENQTLRVEVEEDEKEERKLDKQSEESSVDTPEEQSDDKTSTQSAQEEDDFLSPFGSTIDFNSNNSNLNSLTDNSFSPSYRNSPPAYSFNFPSSPSQTSSPLSITNSNDSLPTMIRKNAPSSPLPPSPLASQSTIQQMLSDSSELSHSTFKKSREHTEEEDNADYKVSKRRLMFFLFIIPLFYLIFNHDSTSHPSSSIHGRNRGLLSYDDPIIPFQYSMLNLIQIITTVSYCILGLMGVKWMTNSFIWLVVVDPIPQVFYSKV